jgi:hypothetical protein
LVLCVVHAVLGAAHFRSKMQARSFKALELVSRNALAQPAPVGWTQAASFVPAAVFLLVAVLAYGLQVLVFKGKSLGGWAWFLPFLAASAVAVWSYRKLCLQMGVLTDSESFELGRNIIAWTLGICVLVMAVLQGSLIDALSSALLGLPIVATLLLAGLLVIKTRLLMQEHPDRADQDRMGEDEIAKLRADFRRQKGIADLPKDRSYTPASSTSYTKAAANDAELIAQAKALPVKPLPEIQTRRAPASAPMPISQPAPLISSDDEIRRKILAVRAAALKAQRKAQKTNPGDL